MKRQALLISAFLLALCFNLPMFAGADKVKLPEETKVEIVLKESISSGNSAVGQPVQPVVAEDVVINGKVLVKEGTKVKAQISQLETSKRMAKGGNISISFDSTKAVDGQKVPLRAAIGRSGYNNTGSMVALTVAFGIVGFLRKGEEAYIKSGTKISAYVDENVEIETDVNATKDDE